MRELINWMRSDELAEFLIISNLLFILGIFYVMMSIFLLRRKRIFRTKRKGKLDALVFKLVSDYLFNDKDVDVQIKKLYNIKGYSRSLINRVLFKNIIQLHKSYTGEYATRLEELFNRTGLKEYCHKKLRRASWDERQELIRDLCEMKAIDLADDIRPFIYDKRDQVRMEALVGMTKLEGLPFLTSLDAYEPTITEWMQINIMHVVKRLRKSEDLDYSHLLKSKNETVVLLGVRLIGYFQDITKWKDTITDRAVVKSPILRREIIQVMVHYEKMKS